MGKYGAECTMGRIENKKFMRKPSCKNQKFTNAYTFWHSMVRMVREGLMTYESLMASINGSALCSAACGTGGGGGSGGKAVYGYTGTSPPETNKQLWYKSFLSIAATILLGLMLLFVACEDFKIENDSIAELLLKGENVKSSDFKTAEKNLEDGDILHAVSDGKFHWTPKEYSASEIAWLVKRLKELESTGKGVIQGKNYINPRDFTEEDSTYLANLGFQVYRYEDDDPCDPLRVELCELRKDSCQLRNWIPGNGLDSAIYKPVDISGNFWPHFRQKEHLFPLPRSYLDTVKIFILVDSTLWRQHGNPLPVNAEGFQKFHDANLEFVALCDTLLPAKREELQECEDENSSIHFPQMKSQSMGTSVYKDPKKKQEQYTATLPSRNTGKNAYITRRGAMQYRNGR